MTEDDGTRWVIVDGGIMWGDAKGIVHTYDFDKAHIFTRAAAEAHIHNNDCLSMMTAPAIRRHDEASILAEDEPKDWVIIDNNLYWNKGGLNGDRRTEDLRCAKRYTEAEARLLCGKFDRLMTCRDCDVKDWIVRCGEQWYLSVEYDRRTCNIDHALRLGENSAKAFAATYPDFKAIRFDQVDPDYYSPKTVIDAAPTPEDKPFDIKEAGAKIRKIWLDGKDVTEEARAPGVPLVRSERELSWAEVVMLNGRMTAGRCGETKTFGVPMLQVEVFTGGGVEPEYVEFIGHPNIGSIQMVTEERARAWGVASTKAGAPC